MEWVRASVLGHKQATSAADLNACPDAVTATDLALVNGKFGIALFFQRLHLALGLCETLLHFKELSLRLLFPLLHLASEILELV